MKEIEDFIVGLSSFIWDIPLLVVLLGGGVYFMLYCRFLPFKYLFHAIDVLKGKYDNENEKGQISHFQALSGHLASTVGMGNISGVAVAIVMGGPGALFWMWVCAFFGMATKYFECTLSIMYRGVDTEGNLQGGPMYVIKEGLSKKWRFLAFIFCFGGLFGSTPMFQTNQIIIAFNDIILISNGIEPSLITNLSLGMVITIITALVIFGGVTRIVSVSTKLVPFMVIIYGICTFFILIDNFDNIIPMIKLIFTDAFTAKSVLGGSVGSIILIGAQRASFSNEAGVGTASMMHGAAKTDEPVREGLVAMLGPAIDTLIVCTFTGLAILSTGVWQANEHNGISLTAKAFESSLPFGGNYLLFLCVIIFAITTIFGFAYYGRKCLGFLIGEKYGNYFNYWYIAIVIIGSITTLKVVVGIIDIAFGIMAFPTIISAIILSPKVMKETKSYFNRYKNKGFIKK